MTRAEKHQRWEDMRAYKAEGHTMQEVADKFGMAKHSAQMICKGIAPQPSTVKGRPSPFKGILKDDSKVAEFISERMPEAEYAGNYTGADGRVDLRCKQCGTVFNRSMISVRKGHCCCPKCSKKKADEVQAIRKEVKRIKAEEAERKRKDREERKAERRKIEAEKREARKHPCIVCGTITDRPKYCCTACANKAANKTKEHRRRERIKTQMVDKDITVEGLFRRDVGKCWLCGERCNFEDYTVRDGNFIVGDWYPSIDHVIPLVKGGEHSWANVKLAHHRCNSIKHDKII